MSLLRGRGVHSSSGVKVKSSSVEFFSCSQFKVRRPGGNPFLGVFCSTVLLGGRQSAGEG